MTVQEQMATIDYLIRQAETIGYIKGRMSRGFLKTVLVVIRDANNADTADNMRKLAAKACAFDDEEVDNGSVKV